MVRVVFAFLGDLGRTLSATIQAEAKINLKDELVLESQA
jgi:hypothetical protein